MEIIMSHFGISKQDKMQIYDASAVLYIAHGQGRITVNRQSFILNEGTIIVLNKSMPFIIERTSDLLEVYECLAIGDANCGLPDSYCILSDFSNKKIRDVFVKMIDEYMAENWGYTPILQAYFVILSHLIVRKLEAPASVDDVTDNKWAGATIQYIYKNLYRKIDLAELAKLHNITKEHLCRTFKKQTGVTITQFIRNARMEKVKDLLVNTNRSIRSINEMFSLDNYYLQKTFRKSTGMTMKEYRRNHRGESSSRS